MSAVSSPTSSSTTMRKLLATIPKPGKTKEKESLVQQIPLLNLRPVAQVIKNYGRKYCHTKDKHWCPLHGWYDQYTGSLCFVRKLWFLSVCNIGPWGQSYKTFYDRNLHSFVISQSVCTGKPFLHCLIFDGEARSLP